MMEDKYPEIEGTEMGVEPEVDERVQELAPAVVATYDILSPGDDTGGVGVRLLLMSDGAVRYVLTGATEANRTAS